ncbi:alpha/beta knot methyltransferases [Lucifera butyrica]|uniref:Alpha/beta knot methyltransferases n=1 Tax=Lucifera butyrica TaxID=1351585 RepID=A0A498R5X0_9FIRM|nr:RNA methyltransferase [Lucifera butyrica]VBB05642.1 alpha/beta knot methyltransferases [Lucifera butyrica]
MAVPVYLGLVHYPIYNKHGEVITTAVTNFDVHDIARTSRTYGIKRYYIIHPLESQVNLVKEIMGYWQAGYGGEYNPDRREAFRILDILPDITAAAETIRSQEGQYPLIVTTDARKFTNTVSYGSMRQRIEQGNRPCLLLFGTGWGMEKTVMEKFDYILEPIYGPSDYNHLPVRAAVAIILDRLLGEKWWE